MEDIIKAMEEYAVINNIPIMQKEGLQFMQHFIETNNIRTILELGSAIGYSAIQMARINKNIRIVTIERDEVRYNEAIKNIEASGLKDQIEIYLADALEFETDEVFDMIFIDAAKAQYIKFFERYKNNLDCNGTIISDNLKFHGFVETKERIKNRNTRQLVGKIRKYITFLEENNDFTTEFISKGDGIALTKRKVL